jgi:hypothetical protein
MPTKPKVTPDAKALNSADILNVAKAEIGGDYASMIPDALKEGTVMTRSSGAQYKVTADDSLASLRAIGNVMMQFQPMQNAFLTNIINRIGRVMITSKQYYNPWAGFKKGLLENGETVEEIFVAIAKPFQFDPVKAESEVFRRRIPDVQAAFHSMNYQKYYPTTVSNDQLRQAFLSWEGITDLIDKIIEQVYTGANYDEFLVMKYMIAQVALKGEIAPVHVDSLDKTTAEDITAVMVEQALNLTYMGKNYNMAGVQTHTEISQLYTILTSKVRSIFNVHVLAQAFNMDKAELMGRQIGVDGFGEIDEERLAIIFEDDPYTNYVPFTEDELTQLKNIIALMVDENWFMIFDNYYNMTEIYNPQGLYWNYFYHVWKTFSISPFNNAVLFTQETPAVQSVTVSPATLTVTKGQSATLTANVVTTGFAKKAVVWTLSGELSDNTVIDPTGKITIGVDETATTITATATSVYDNTKSSSATITVG